jgi:hypothetical protein
MARSQSVFLTAVVAMVLGIVIGVVGLLALVPQLSQSADQVATQTEDGTKPGVYGTK